ncbi:MAG TPA: tetratricopeptide repeat protein [bacterium]|nr:tetratricopeptide repeat protein [bacterium]
MFTHLIKDYIKKLEAAEERLEVSLDRDEIQTLGLKLRFYFNEVKHYRKLIDDLFDRIVEIQEKYGFVSEEEELSHDISRKKREPKENGEENVVELVKGWIGRLEDKGVDPGKLLKPREPEPAVKKEPDGVKPDIQTEKPKEQNREVDRKAGDETEHVEADGQEEKLEKAVIASDGSMLAAGRIARMYQSSQHESAEEIVTSSIDFTDDTPPMFFPEKEKGREKKRAVPEKENIVTDNEEKIKAAEEPVETEVYEQQHSELDGSKGIHLNEYFGEAAPEIPADDVPESVEPIDEGIEPDESIEEEFMPEERPSGEKETITLEDLVQKAMAYIKNMQAFAEVIDDLEKEVIDDLSAEAAEIKAMKGEDEDRAGVRGFVSAEILLKAGRTGTAMNVLEAAIKGSPGFKDSYLLLGDIYYGKNLFARALDQYRGFRDAGGDLESIRWKWMNCLKQAGEWYELMSELEPVDESSDISLLIMKAEVMFRLGRDDEADGIAERIMASSRADTDKALAAIFMGRIRENRKDVLAAIDFYEKSLELNDMNPEACYELGRLYIKHNAVPLARNHLNKILKRFPESEWADLARELMEKEGVF